MVGKVLPPPDGREAEALEQRSRIAEGAKNVVLLFPSNSQTSNLAERR
jgi:hypothetical protein